MPNKIVCNTDNYHEATKPSIFPVTNPESNSIGFCFVNFDIHEPIDCYTPDELIIIRNAIDTAINVNCKPSDLKGQMFLWDFDIINLTVANSEV